MSIKNFKWYYDDNYVWNKVVYNRKEKRSVYSGGQNIENNSVIIKLININNNNNNNPHKFQNILKEIYFLACCKNDNYFNEIIDVFLSENDIDVNIVLKHEGVNLKSLIEYTDYNYEESFPNFSRWAIFRVACGLYELHELGLAHNDIKPANIIVNEHGATKICDLGSTDKIIKSSNSGTSGYYSPRNLLGLGKSKEDDMWALGVVFLELLKKKNKIFSFANFYYEKTYNINDRLEFEFLDILKNYFNIKINGKDMDFSQPIDFNKIKNFIYDNDYDEFTAELKEQVLFGINEDNKLIIKKLLEFDPMKRMTAKELINQNIFKNYKYEKQTILYKENDYSEYLENVNDLDKFKKNLELIREKFIGIIYVEPKK